MEKQPKAYSSTALVWTFCIGAACAGLIAYLVDPRDPVKDPCPKVEVYASVDDKNLREMAGSDGAVAIRTYLAKDDAGLLTAITVPVDVDGAHVKDNSGTLRFRRYKGITGVLTDQTMLTEAAAETSVKGAGTAAKPTWSADIVLKEMDALLGVGGCNGVGLIQRRTSLSDWTFEFVPVKLENGSANVLGDASAARVGSMPCPQYCGRDEALYLHRR